jgi:uncharacterized protein (TIGR02466 family)
MNKTIQQAMLWPTPIWYRTVSNLIKNEENISFNESLTSWVKDQMKKNKSVIKSNKGGWQSNLCKPEGGFEPLVKEIKEFCNNLPLNLKEISITQLWVNVNKKGDWNTIHQHGDHDLSGTYYVKTPKDCGCIVFRDPRPAAISNRLMSIRFDKGEIFIKNVEEGLLVIWPSYLDHFVEPNKTDEERISISFDIKAT